MLDYKETISATDDGPKIVIDATYKWEDFLCFKYPTSCAYCCIGWRTRCPVDIAVQKESRTSRPDGCPLGLVVLSIKN